MVNLPGNNSFTIRELLDDGQYGPDLSDEFVVIKSGLSGFWFYADEAVLNNQTWYELNTDGTWNNVAPFTLQWLVQFGDVNNDGSTLENDLPAIRIRDFCFPSCRDDINGDDHVEDEDLRLIESFIPSSFVPKPSGHETTP